MVNVCEKFKACRETHDVWLLVKIYGKRTPYLELFEQFIDNVSSPIWRLRNGMWNLDERPVKVRLNEQWAIRETERLADEIHTEDTRR